MDEIEAMKAIAEKMELLSGEERARVLSWAASKYGFALNGAPVPAPSSHQAQQTVTPSPEKSSPRVPNGPKAKASKKAKSIISMDKSLNLSPSGKVSGSEFATSKSPANAMQKCVVAVYYLRETIGLESITVAAVYTFFKTLGWPVPADLRNMLQQAGTKGWLDTKDSENIQLTSMGENLVEHSLPLSRRPEVPYILNGVPAAFEDELFSKYREIERNYREHRWEPSELNGGKLCEVAYSILKGHVDGNFPAHPSKPAYFAVACNNLEQAPSHFGRSIRLLIPRILVALYDIRNSRGVGHIGGDVNPNHMDAVCVLHMAKWVVAEFIRVFHGISIDEAQALVEAISDREMPLVWETGAVSRVLDTKLTMLEKTLALLYSNSGPLSETALLASLEHSNPSAYRRDVLRKAHKARLLEYDEKAKTILISPLGSKRVEVEILPKATL